MGDGFVIGGTVRGSGFFVVPNGIGGKVVGSFGLGASVPVPFGRAGGPSGFVERGESVAFDRYSR